MFPDCLELKTILPDRCELKVPTLKAGAGVRKPAYRSKGSDRPSIVCPSTNRVLSFESGTEGNTALHLYGDPRIITVTSQPARVWYEDSNEDRRSHVIDIGAVRDDGYKYGILCKQENKALSSDLTSFCKTLAKMTPRDVADELLIVTERDLPDFELSNAALFYSVRTDFRNSADDALLELAPTLLNGVPIADITAGLGGGRYSFRAVARSIFYGTLICLQRGAILPASIVRFSGSVKPDFERNGYASTSHLAPFEPTDPTLRNEKVKRTPRKRGARQ